MAHGKEPLLKEVNWSEFLAENSWIAPDIVFNVIEDDEKSESIYAHKLLVSGISRVFRKEFYGALKTSNTEVNIKDMQSVQAFPPLHLQP